MQNSNLLSMNMPVMKQYEMFEMKFTAKEPQDSYVDMKLQAEFNINQDRTVVKGFYIGHGTYVIRFYPKQIGTYTYKISGILKSEGSVNCESSNNKGMIMAKDTHFCHENGSPYYPFGTTVYALIHQPESLVNETLDSLKNSPFNKVRYCIFPKHYDYNHNDPLYFPFEKDVDGNWDVHRPCFAYWDNLESIIIQLGNMGIETDLILFHSYDRWGFPFLNREERIVYLEYVLRRLSAIPNIWWSMANEYDFLFNLEMNDWYEIESFINNNDPFCHLLSNHNGMKLYDFSRPAITHCSVQTSAMHMADVWKERFLKPVIFDECCYEGDIQHEWGNITGFEMVNRFWKACAKGAYATHGETYYDKNEILWWAKGGTLKGESASRIAFLKDLIYSFPSPLESWDEKIYEDMSNPTEIIKEGELPPFVRLMMSLSDEEKFNLDWKGASYSGHCGNEIYLKYFARQQVSIYDLKLPKEHTYQIEIIDIWNMTRNILIKSTRGRTTLQLPRKEGIAVLATMIP
ncbi:MAG: DUF5060 domain-containing protein [Lachnospiraceae bacterium]